MTCRIDRLVSEGSVVVIGISGRLTAHDVDMLRSLLEQEAGAVALDLRDLLFGDSNAVGLLARIEASGSELRNCLPYIRECVAQQRRAESHDGDI
jgi:anti-anti-sigma regulatory factor